MRERFGDKERKGVAISTTQLGSILSWSCSRLKEEKGLNKQQAFGLWSCSGILLLYKLFCIVRIILIPLELGGDVPIWEDDNGEL